jgi:hypothetical protein
MARFSAFEIDVKIFEEIDALIRDVNRTEAQFPVIMDYLTELYATTIMGFGIKYSMGPLDPSAGRRSLHSVGPMRTVFGTMPGTHRLTGALRGRTTRQYGLTRSASNPTGPFKSRTWADPGAWKIPVRRITGDYAAGWFVEKMGYGKWRVSNHSREAYFIEFGINHESTGLTDPSNPGRKYRIPRPIFKLSLLNAVRFAKGTGFDIQSLKYIMQQTLTGHEVSPAETMALRPRTFWGVNVDYL